jgi:rubrerythrin
MGTNPDRVRVGRTLSEDEEAVQQVGVRIEESAGELRSITGMRLDDSGFVDFIATGTQISGDFRCADCGYGAVVHGALPQCPMCAGTVWASRGHRS